MSSWLFNIYMDGVVIEVTARLLGRGLSLFSNDGRVECKLAAICRQSLLVVD